MEQGLWRILSLCEKENDRVIKQTAAETGLEFSEVKVLLFLANNPERNTATDIVRAKKMSKAQVSLAVRSLTERGFLHQSPGPNKSVLLSLTEDAGSAAALGQRRQREAMAHMLQGFTPEELSSFQALFARLEENLKGEV